MHKNSFSLYVKRKQNILLFERELKRLVITKVYNMPGMLFVSKTHFNPNIELISEKVLRIISLK